MPVTEYTWDPVTDSILEETDGAGNVLVSYTNEPSAYGPLVSQHRDDESRYFHFDVLGSTRELTDNDGDVTDTFAYDAWENAVLRAGATLTPFRWIGLLGYSAKAYDSKYQIRARTYSPRQAVWLSADWYLFSRGALLQRFNSPGDLAKIPGISSRHPGIYNYSTEISHPLVL